MTQLFDVLCPRARGRAPYVFGARKRSRPFPLRRRGPRRPAHRLRRPQGSMCRRTRGLGAPMGGRPGQNRYGGFEVTAGCAQHGQPSRTKDKIWRDNLAAGVNRACQCLFELNRAPPRRPPISMLRARHQGGVPTRQNFVPSATTWRAPVLNIDMGGRGGPPRPRQEPYKPNLYFLLSKFCPPAVRSSFSPKSKRWGPR